jgi:hypothetical protein
MLGKKEICEAELILVQGDKFNEILLPFLMIDTGLAKQEEIEKLFAKFKVVGDNQVIILAFRKTGFFAKGC